MQERGVVFAFVHVYIRPHISTWATRNSCQTH